MDQPVQSSRSSFSESSAPATQGPIPLFDTHLRHLTDSYLAFFQERKRIEENYVDSLRRLHRKIKTADAQLEERGDLSTIRSAWGEVVDNVDREAQARQALCSTLSTDVIVPLTSLKDTQERTRKRIKEDLKDSSAAYTEYAEVMLPKLKSRYTKKYSEVEEQKKAASVIPSAPLPSPAIEQSVSSGGRLPSIAPSRPTVTAPQPLRALDRRPSGSHHPGRNRSPSSSSGAFSDLAHHGKKQLGQLMGFLDKGGNAGVGRENQALRTVKAKRDADEADKEYRKGVHWLETLRLRRTKILESGFKSVELFVEEMSGVMKKILVKYADNLSATTTTQTQLSNHMRSVIERISVEKDLARLKMSIPKSLASAIPDPILYEHGAVGECNDLIFGFTLTDYATARGLPEGEIPRIIRLCIEQIDKRGLECEGIYRVSGRHAVVQAMQHEIERDEASFSFSSKGDIYAVASLLKLYLRELPEPVFRFSLQDRLNHTEERDQHLANRFLLLRSKIRRLPPVHQATLRAILEHLARVVAKCDKNKMDAKNVAIVFGTVIFGEDEMPKGGDLLSMSNAKDTLMEDLIMHVHLLYDTDPPEQSSPTLPPIPVGEPIAPITYGSKTTKVANVPPANPIPLVQSPSTPTPSSPQELVSPSPPQDFTPKLPPRPNYSIHPSARTFSASPSISKADKNKALPLTQVELEGTDTSFDAPPTTPSDTSSAYESLNDHTNDHRNSISFPALDSTISLPVIPPDSPGSPSAVDSSSYFALGPTHPVNPPDDKLV